MWIFVYLTRCVLTRLIEMVTMGLYSITHYWIHYSFNQIIQNVDFRLFGTFGTLCLTRWRESYAVSEGAKKLCVLQRSYSVLSELLSSKCSLWQIVKTQMKYRMVLHFIRVYTNCLLRQKLLQRNKYKLFGNYNLWPLVLLYNGTSKVYLSNQ